MQFRVEMKKKTFFRIFENKSGPVHHVKFGVDDGGTFTANRYANLHFTKVLEGTPEDENGVKSFVCTINDGRKSFDMVLTLYPQYGTEGIVKMRHVHDYLKSKQKSAPAKEK